MLQNKSSRVTLETEVGKTITLIICVVELAIISQDLPLQMNK